MMLLSLFVAAAAGFLALLIFQKMFYPYFWDDLIYYLKFQRVKRLMKLRMGEGVVTFLDCFVHQARKTPDKPFIVFEGEVYTFEDVDKRSNKVAQVFKQQGGVKKGDTVALLMSNEPDFICVWFGLCKLGCQVAFLNFNIKSKSLLHCFESCEAKTLVLGADFIHLLDDVLFTLQQNKIDLWLLDRDSPYQGVNTLLDKIEGASEESVPDVCSPTDIMSNFIYIFTSGTTGLPKAARISHLKAVMCLCFLRLCGATTNDNIYITLPLYHMSASLLGIGGCIELGATCVLKRKFSASQFWSDCQKYNVTIFQYIGELCRYLVNQPKVAGEMNHKVRIVAGSGLRSDVWKEFIKRFGKIKIVESYGLTEASIGFINYTNKIGPIGRAGFLNKRILPFDFLKYDLQSNEPVRTEKGYCVKVKKGETGLLVAPVSVMNPFLGYAGNRELSEKKLLRNVFKRGDLYFNTGDLMLHDDEDFVYFRDRVGDTFRWKAENVATTEVADILSSVDFLQEVNVYGVSVPGYEGKVGMAALVLKCDQKLDGKELYAHLIKHLPLYSWPWFLRVQMSLDVTETFKQQKGKLVAEGFNPAVIKEPLYVLDTSEKTYIPLTEPVYDDIVSGQIRL
ncbi:long-chain fatty acid transport protein 6 [Lepisosteus oculatus]|uniref:long-chain fatty acid transport protein 6 n=1 Tax=Lepisosteus oculatus TaxID=7918 RepID=UPI0007403931|nr:PREDICTED: long-chain fatty acid transport protein 6-like [Lepisosteus oculatus]